MSRGLCPTDTFTLGLSRFNSTFVIRSMPVVLIEKQAPQVTLVTLNRPERRNALTIELLTELCAAINVASEQPEQRVLILRGAGAAFCTGLDLKEAADTTKAHATAEMVANTLVAISQTRLVTIAA